MTEQRGQPQPEETPAAIKRVIALLVDTALLSLLSLPVAGLVVRLFPVVAHRPWRWLLVFGLAQLAWPYWAPMEASPLRATLGKLVVGLAVTDAEERRLTLRQATRRWLARLVSVVPVGLGALALLEDDRRALHDRIAGTMVVGRPALWPAALVLLPSALAAWLLVNRLLPKPHEIPCRGPLPAGTSAPASLPYGFPGIQGAIYERVEPAERGLRIKGLIHLPVREANEAAEGALYQWPLLVDAGAPQFQTSSFSVRGDEYGIDVTITEGRFTGARIKLDVQCSDRVAFELTWRAGAQASSE